MNDFKMARGRTPRILVALLIGALAFAAQGCGYNTLVEQDEGVKAAWAEVENQLQRRNDLIPNLVETVKGYAAHEKEVLTEVTEARSSVAGAQTPEKTMNASNRLTSALSRLLVVVERYPDLKANQNFIRLQDELAGTENRIATARGRYNKSVETYNTTARTFPNVIYASTLGFPPRPHFDAPASVDTPPAVAF